MFELCLNVTKKKFAAKNTSSTSDQNWHKWKKILNCSNFFTDKYKLSNWSKLLKVVQHFLIDSFTNSDRKALGNYFSTFTWKAFCIIWFFFIRNHFSFGYGEEYLSQSFHLSKIFSKWPESDTMQALIPEKKRSKLCIN